MLLGWIPLRLHGWLDEIATASYLAAAWALHFGGLALAVVVGAALVHFANTRLTDYPRGQLALYSMRVHARIELAEGLALLAAAIALPTANGLQTGALGFFGVAQVGAATLSKLR
jgi:hypothetical protein